MTECIMCCLIVQLLFAMYVFWVQACVEDAMVWFTVCLHVCALGVMECVLLYNNSSSLSNGEHVLRASSQLPVLG